MPPPQPCCLQRWTAGQGVQRMACAGHSLDVSKILQVLRNDDLKQLVRKNVEDARACGEVLIQVLILGASRIRKHKAACRPIHPHLPSYGRLEWDRVLIRTSVAASRFGCGQMHASTAFRLAPEPERPLPLPLYYGEISSKKRLRNADRTLLKSWHAWNSLRGLALDPCLWAWSIPGGGSRMTYTSRYSRPAG